MSLGVDNMKIGKNEVYVMLRFNYRLKCVQSGSISMVLQKKHVSAIHICLCLHISFLHVSVSFLCLTYAYTYIYVTHAVTHAYKQQQARSLLSCIETNRQQPQKATAVGKYMLKFGKSVGVWLCWQHNNSNWCEIRFRRESSPSEKLTSEKLRSI